MRISIRNVLWSRDFVPCKTLSCLFWGCVNWMDLIANCKMNWEIFIQLSSDLKMSFSSVALLLLLFLLKKKRKKNCCKCSQHTHTHTDSCIACTNDLIYELSCRLERWFSIFDVSIPKHLIEYAFDTWPVFSIWIFS